MWNRESDIDSYGLRGWNDNMVSRWYRLNQRGNSWNIYGYLYNYMWNLW
jgi:hypothetical protein